MSKASIRDIGKDYIQTLRDNSDGLDRLSLADLFEQVGIPVALGAVAVGLNWKLADTSGLIAAISIVASLMCAVAVLLFEIRSQEFGQKLTPQERRLQDETFADVMWAIVVGFLISALLVAGEQVSVFADEDYGRFGSGLVAALCLHFGIVILMALKRLRAVYSAIRK